MPLRRSRGHDPFHGGGDRRGRVVDRRPRVRALSRPLDLMGAPAPVVDVLLALGVAGELLCGLGGLVMRTTPHRLPYAAAATAGPPFPRPAPAPPRRPAPSRRFAGPA